MQKNKKESDVTIPFQSDWCQNQNRQCDYIALFGYQRLCSCALIKKLNYNQQGDVPVCNTDQIKKLVQGQHF